MILEICQYGHPVLREKGVPVEAITPEIRQLAADMIETMYAANGVGLAAQQIGLAMRITVIDVAPSEIAWTGETTEGRALPMPLVLINPRLSDTTGEQAGEEGCLSIPAINAEIKRAEQVTVTATDLEGATLQFTCTGLLARAVQHELDHLNGVLFIDRMDAATRVSVAGKLKRMQKETLAELKKRKTALKG